ncbi:MAG: hypothetical protein R3C58_10250 [Parvularculaceae bacterium]
MRTTESLKEARTFFEQTIAADSEYAPGYAGLAATLLLLADGEGNYGALDAGVAAELARSNVDKALARDPRLAEAHAVAGRIAAMKGDDAAALADYDRAIEINPSYADAWLWKSNLLKAERDYEASSAALDVAFQLDPLSPVVLYNKGFHQALQRNFADARKYYAAILDLEENSPLGLRGLADVARRAGDVAESARIWKRAIDASPASAQYKDNLVGALLTLEMPDAASLYASEDYDANLKFAGGDFDGGLNMLRLHYAAAPDDPWMAFEAGWYELLYGDRERGYDALLKADAGVSEDDAYAMPYCSPAIEAAFAMRARGDATGAEKRVSECEGRLSAESEAGVRSTELDYLGARLAAMKGDADGAASLIESAYAEGWREPWTARDPLIENVKDNPRVAAVLNNIAADLERQRSALAQEAAAWKKPSAN